MRYSVSGGQEKEEGALGYNYKTHRVPGPGRKMAFYACHQARISELLHWCLSWLENESVKKAVASTRNAQILSVIVFHIFWRKDVLLKNYLWETELIFNEYCLRNRNCGFHNIHDFAFICIHIKKLIPFAIIQKKCQDSEAALQFPWKPKT